MPNWSTLCRNWIFVSVLSIPWLEKFITRKSKQQRKVIQSTIGICYNFVHWWLLVFFPWLCIILSQLKFSASLSGVEFSTDDEPESVSDRPSSAQNSKQNGQTSTQRPPKVAFFRCIFKGADFIAVFHATFYARRLFATIWKK